MDSVREGEGGMIWEKSIETCIIYMKQVASPDLMHDTGCLRLVHWDDPEGWYGERGGRGSGRGTRVYLWRIHIDVCQNQYNNVINLQFNKFIFKKNKIIFKKPPFPVSID